MKSCITALFVLVILPVMSQPYYYHTYFDKEKKKLKSIHQVTDTLTHTYNGTFQIFYESGKLSLNGQFEKNSAIGIWEFYYENGKLKMKGPYQNNVTQGVWEFYYENGVKSMEGELYNNSKEGLWKFYYTGGELKETGKYKNNSRVGGWQTFYEDGELKSKATYQNSVGMVTEFYPSGKKKGEGMQENLLKTGRWKYYSEGGKLTSSGNYVEGKKSGLWSEFFDNGKTAFSGSYADDKPVGDWVSFYKDGKVLDKGAYKNGKKAGMWQSFSLDGTLKSEAQYNLETGEYTEYYPSRKIKTKGQFENNKRTGLWIFYSENGTKEGECQYTEGKGIFRAYYPNGLLKNKGAVEDDMRVGEWELYDTQGKLTGFYKHIYQEPKVRTPLPAKVPARHSFAGKLRHLQFFTPRYPEYKSAIISTNPLFSFLGFIPFNLEFYTQERIGYEFLLESIRSPFFISDENVLPMHLYRRGISFRLRQKFYFPTRFGMIYAAHVLGSVAVYHLINYSTPVKTTISAHEQIYDYGIMIGDRLMRHNNRNGFTIDAYIGYSAGIRIFTDESATPGAFDSLDQRKFVNAFRFGLTVGYSISFSRK